MLYRLPLRTGNMDQAAEARRQYVYSRVVRGSMVRGGGQVSRRENREYSVIPRVKAELLDA